MNVIKLDCLQLVESTTNNAISTGMRVQQRKQSEYVPGHLVQLELPSGRLPAYVVPSATSWQGRQR